MGARPRTICVVCGKAHRFPRVEKIDLSRRWPSGKWVAVGQYTILHKYQSLEHEHPWDATKELLEIMIRNGPCSPHHSNAA